MQSISTIIQPNESNKEADSSGTPSTSDSYLVHFDADDPANPKVFFQSSDITVLIRSNDEW